MKTMYDIRELAAKVHEVQHAKTDYLATPSAQLRAGVGEDGAVSMSLLKGPDDPVQLSITEHAHNQIASKLDIPRRYYHRVREQAPALLAQNVNHWLAQDGDRRMVRTVAGTMRAYLSDRYQRIENEQILEMAMPVLAEIPDVQIVSTALTETNMYIKAVAPRLTGEVRKGDAVQAGVILRNSEVGSGAIVIEPFVYRLVCLNGMTAKDSRFRRNHVGARISDDDLTNSMLSDEAIAADDNALLLRFRDVLRGTVTQEFLDACIGKLRDATERKIEGDVPKAVEVLSQKVGLGKHEGSGVLKYLISGADLSQYGLIQAVTRFSQDVANYDRASELETIGGNILELPSSSWREIANA